MSDAIKITIDGKEIEAQLGQTILEAADEAGIYIPRLCSHPELKPIGSCRVCTVVCDGRPQAACVKPVMDGMVIENETPELLQHRRNIIDMMFVEGNHFCMFCEKSGNCELQALAYRFGITAPQYPFQFPEKEVDASHPDILLDHNRCIMCARCVRASQELDGKNVFQSIGRGFDRKIGVNGEKALGDTDMAVADRAADICPVGCIIKKRVGFEVPVGERLYDKAPIGSDIEGVRS
ncbi:2Fe-2S iron-sulfur cluster-binding protein [Pontiella sulfatireligans]|uniref:NAD-reducing hydrogenase HoxS subunit gamma n=1 Tax=Pontiella sulfatireligans TaxID=2750658 RepID=A0A6C2UNN7_9BACT|nr:2Fe-2S iron-sulfur cluster-binding protein [Pontiella sulfatireligans]VGO20891.1 NAD-reducing hydrogenase HoxS subunit gamma [Pontiella sulfatireligans]